MKKVNGTTEKINNRLINLVAAQELSNEYNRNIIAWNNGEDSYLITFVNGKYAVHLDTSNNYDNELLETMINNEEAIKQFVKKFELDSIAFNDISHLKAIIYVGNKVNDSVWTQSPYSESFYNSDDISWGYKPENSLRISDHWNFESNGSLHCETTNGFTTGWAVGQYKNGRYEILEVF